VAVCMYARESPNRRFEHFICLPIKYQSIG
jgi:hypothetical protein